MGALCFVTQDGHQDWFVDDDVLESLLKFNENTHIFCFTDCCHSGTVCDLDSDRIAGRPVVHMAAVRDEEEADEVEGGEGGLFTSSILETLEMLVKLAPDDEYSALEIHNANHNAYNALTTAEFHFAHTKGYDPDTFRWPLLPPADWTVSTALDQTQKWREMRAQWKMKVGKMTGNAFNTDLRKHATISALDKMIKAHQS